LLRLTKLKALLDVNKIKKIIKKFYDDDNSSEGFQEYQDTLNYFKIFRLMIIVLLLTYLIGCLFWFYCSNINSNEDLEKSNTFITKFSLGDLDVGT